MSATWGVTPRTDAQCFPKEWEAAWAWSRQLERELNKANEQLSSANRSCDVLYRKLKVATEYVRFNLTQENPVAASEVLKEIMETK